MERDGTTGAHVDEEKAFHKNPKTFEAAGSSSKHLKSKPFLQSHSSLEEENQQASRKEMRHTLYQGIYKKFQNVVSAVTVFREGKGGGMSTSIKVSPSPREQNSER